MRLMVGLHYEMVVMLKVDLHVSTIMDDNNYSRYLLTCQAVGITCLVWNHIYFVKYMIFIL